MDRDEAEHLLVIILSDILEQGKTELLDLYYAPDMVGHYADHTYSLNDTKNRIAYMDKRYPKRKFHLLDFLLVEDGKVLIYRSRQTGLDNYYGKRYSIHFVTVYRLNSYNKIAEVWLMPDLPMDYMATPDSLEQSKPRENNPVAELEKQHFIHMLVDAQYYCNAKKVPLTRRETDILLYYLNGYTAKETGEVLNISHRTVEDHISTILRKYGCSSKEELRKTVFP